MAPQVGFEPTTLRLTARRIAVTGVAQESYKSLGISRLQTVKHLKSDTELLNVEPLFERVSPQKSPHPPICSLALSAGNKRKLGRAFVLEFTVWVDATLVGE
jgi:hypothetical protein